MVSNQLELRKNMNYPLMYSSEIIKWQSYNNLFEWIKLNTSPKEQIACGLDTMVYLYTDRSSIRPFYSKPIALFYGHDSPAIGTTKELGTLLNKKNLKYLVTTPMPIFSEEKHFFELLKNLLQECPNCLDVVYIGSDSRFRIYEANLKEIETLIN
jgi:hypothetical protein